jgi:hypothetical protein
MWNLKFLEIQNIFQNFQFSKVLYHMQMGCNVHDIQNKVGVYNTKNKNLKYFGMIQNYEKFSR